MDKWLRYISIAAKAGSLRGGEVQTEKAVRQGTAMLVVLAEDASINTQKKVRSLCEMTGTPLLCGGTRALLGTLAGKDLRSTLTVTDPGLANAMQKAFTGRISNDGGNADGSENQSS